MSRSDDELHDSLARYASENSSLRRSAKKNYEARRRIEGAIRRHAEGRCDCRTTRACLVALARLVPKAPRPAYKKAVPAKR